MAIPKGHIVGKTNSGKTVIYNVLLNQFNSETKQWKFSREQVEESVLIHAIINNKVDIQNAQVNRMTLTGRTGGLNRFTPNVPIGIQPIVIIAELRRSDNLGLLGYKIATSKGEVKNIRLKELIGFCENFVKAANSKHSDAVPIQNAMFMPNSDGASAYIRPYIKDQFMIESIEVHRPGNVVKAEPNKDANKQLSRIEEIFSKEQIEQLKLGRQQGVNIKIYGNNKLSADQMKELRIALVNGIDPRPFADPRFKPDAMKAYRIAAKYGANIRQFINPAYDRFQISEIYTAQLSGCDISLLADPSMSATDMAKKRIEMESKLWREEDVKVIDIINRLNSQKK